MIEANRVSAVTHLFRGDFEASRQFAMRVAQIWRSERALPSPVEDPLAPAVSSLCQESLSDWHLGEIASGQAAVAGAIALAKELNDLHSLAEALLYAAILAHFERNPAEVERYSSDLIEFSTRNHFGYFLTSGTIVSGWGRSTSGDTAKGIAWIERGIRGFRALGGALLQPYFLSLKAEALHLANRTSEALKTINEAGALAERREERFWRAELHRLRGVFLAALGADETKIEASFQAAISTAKEQKSVSLEKRAEATYAEYRRQKASGSGGRAFRLPLC
jgi:adenylate cyclase